MAEQCKCQLEKVGSSYAGKLCPMHVQLIEEAVEASKRELEKENARLKAAFLRYIQHDNACLNRWGEWIKQGHPCEGPPCGTSGDWNAEKCGCAEEARRLVAQCRHELETYQTPDNGVGGGASCAARRLRSTGKRNERAD